MEEIKDGEYIRTKQGTISKIEDSEFDIRFIMPDGKTVYRNWKEDFGGAYVSYEEIVKHSFNLIDLIEVDDIVVDDFTNVPYKVSKVEQDYICCNCDMVRLKPNVIKTILTKEQYKNLEYKVEE